MSNLLVQNIKHTNNTTSMTVDSSGQVTIRGESSATTTNLQQGLCKVWVNYTGISTTAERDSFNVTSLTDVATGKTTITIANDMANANYSGFFYCNAHSGTAYNSFSNHYAGGWGDLATGSFKNNSHDNSSDVDSYMNITGVMGDLA